MILSPLQTVEGEVFAFEDAADILILKQRIPSSNLVSIRVLKASCVKRVRTCVI